jgi:hypothetical protein
MLIVRAHDVGGVDVHGTPSGALERGGQDLGRHPFSAGDEPIARAGRHVAEERDRAAQAPILARGGVDHRQQRCFR